MLSLRLNTVEDHDLQVGISELERCEVQAQSPVGGLQLQSSLVIGHNFGTKRRSLGARKSNTLRETANFEPATVGCIPKYPPVEFVIDGDRRRDALISPPRIVHEQLDRQRTGRPSREGNRHNKTHGEKGK